MELPYTLVQPPAVRYAAVRCPTAPGRVYGFVSSSSLRSTSKEKSMILAHSFRGFGPWPAGLLFRDLWRGRCYGREPVVWAHLLTLWGLQIRGKGSGDFVALPCPTLCALATFPQSLPPKALLPSSSLRLGANLQCTALRGQFRSSP